MLHKFTHDLKQEFSGYNFKRFSADLLAGLTVAAVALPLALAFGVSSGADAATGMITAIIAGIIIGSLSGASYQISGPTGAMAAILLGLSASHGLQGMLLAGFLSGIVLLAAALLKFGKLVSYIPEPVITGFTSGIAIIIGLGQIDNFFGTVSKGTNSIDKITSYAAMGLHPDWHTVAFGVLVVAVMLLWPRRWRQRFPSSLAGIIIALAANLLLNWKVAEIGTIPKTLLSDNRLNPFSIPWGQLPSFIMPAVSIAALGMIESLLCGASAGKMKQEKMDAQRELVAQGIGNIIIPFFGGIPATAAIARTSVAIKSGGNTRMVSIIHSLTLILSMLFLAPVMSKIPLSALAGVLIVTAYRMNEWDAIRDIFKKRFKTSIAQFLVTMAATFLFDLTIAIVLGIVVSVIVFLARSCKLSVEVSDVDSNRLTGRKMDTDHSLTKIIYLTGPLFFGTQEQLAKQLENVKEEKSARTIILSMRGAPSVDVSAISQLEALARQFSEQNVTLLFCGVQPKVKKMFDRYGFSNTIGQDHFYWDAIEAMEAVKA